MDLRKLKTLIDLVSESNISELEITETEGKVRIVKGGGAAPVQYVQTLAPQAAARRSLVPRRRPPRLPKPHPPAMR
jgi:acetyl-CoA carboxylase biotin carboxyl carrier protein